MPGDCFSQTLIETVYRRAHQNHPINYVIFSRQMLSSFMLPFSRWSEIYGRTGRLKIFEGKLQCNRMMFPFKPFLLQQLLSIAIHLISCPYRTEERVLNMHLLTISQLCEKMYYEGFILRTLCDFVQFNFSFFFKVKKNYRSIIVTQITTACFLERIYSDQRLMTGGIFPSLKQFFLYFNM